MAGHRLTLVGLRKAHQTRHTVRALRQVPVLQPISLVTGAGLPQRVQASAHASREAVQPSLRKRLETHLDGLEHRGVVSKGSTSGAARITRQTGSYAPVAANSTTGNTGRDQNKVVVQAVAAEVGA